MRQGFVFSIIAGIFLCAPVFGVGGDMGGADPNGSPEKPYLIEDLDDFDEFASNSAYWASGVHTKLMTDIDLSGRTYTTAVIAPDADGQYPYDGMMFSGILDGNNNVIHNFSAYTPDNSYIAIFGYIDTDGEVHNLSIHDATIIGNDYVACLAGIVLNSTINNCSVSGILECRGYTTGGLIGKAWTSSISNCESNVELHSVGHSAGGLIGDNEHSSVYNCHSWATVSGDWANLGGLIGHNYGGILINCSSTATVSATDPYVDSVGGLAGYSSGGGMISSCWANSQTTGRNDVGGGNWAQFIFHRKFIQYGTG